MSDLSLFYGPNAGYVLELYERFQKDPNSVDADTRAFFEHWDPESALLMDSTASSARLVQSLPIEPVAEERIDVARVTAAARLARFIRQRGHLGADIDPLGLTPPQDPGLELDTHGLHARDLALLPSSVVGGPIADETQNALDAIAKLRQVYSGSIGYEDEHLQIAVERYWLRDAAESGRFFDDFDADRKRDILERLTEVEVFERYLHNTFVTAKRFSIEGNDMLVPMLDEIIRSAAATGMHEVVLGMAHRGRLNVLAHILGKPYEVILAEFDNSKRDEGASVSGKGSRGYSGDVKYHLGFRRRYRESGVQEMPLTLVPNPSHLEYVNPVVEGHARAAQEDRSQKGEPNQDARASLPLLIHGDAAFPGQGIVAETLNLSQLSGYRTDGTIHIIVNNQIGFTTLPGDARSTLYASDLAKGFEIPIVHVNADDPVACIAAARMAHAYREHFRKDFLIDLIGYRRYGHNEGDEPTFTQPRMYEIIATHPTVREKWAKELEKQGIVSREEATELVTAVTERLKAARSGASKDTASNPVETLGRSVRIRPADTGVPTERLTEYNAALFTVPEGFRANPRLEKSVLSRRQEALTVERGIDWGHAETLAFASILAEGTPIRLTGQDSERGTFGQRNLVLHDTVTGDRHVPLQQLPAARAAFAVYNSPLSENAVLGFEYGYSMHAPGVLVLWESQFGDFANSAQVITDQFLVSGHAKWRQIPSLVLLLPHGYEGQGPEHSSARLERFLQLAANDNVRIVNCTTAAQYFHLLRRQAALLEADPRPLIVMTPKSLLRHRGAGASLADLTQGAFQTVIDDAEARERADQVTRLILCSGKVAMDLRYEPNGTPREAYTQAERVAVVRVEQLYPFPTEELRAVIDGYPNLREVVWLQEEPRNMGAWTFMEPRLRELVEWRGDIRYVGRPESASPAEGSMARHAVEQVRILKAALAEAPTVLARQELEGWGLGARRSGG
jgi:2-oxoglutarate dehydrogenase E1 component